MPKYTQQYGIVAEVSNKSCNLDHATWSILHISHNKQHSSLLTSSPIAFCLC